LAGHRLGAPEGSGMSYSIAGFVRDYAPSRLTAIRGPDDVAQVCRGLQRAQREVFVVLLLNTRHELMKRVTVSVGSLNSSIVSPRECFRPAILASAASVIFAHNHPSGDPEPSEEDLAITKRLVDGGDLLGISVLDHVIVARRGITSLRARDVLGGQS
jgi:DNA repair protein RadC